MKFVDPTETSYPISFRQAVRQSAGQTGHLIMPDRLPRLSAELQARLSGSSFQSVAADLTALLLEPEIDCVQATDLTHKAFSFAPKLRQIDHKLFVLELFTGPTLSFKDFGANFLAHCLRLFTDPREGETTVLVATSGDTGSAVANAFYELPGFRVILLYPGGKISPIQEAQITTCGQNIVAARVSGDFDDCQRMVKAALADQKLASHYRLTSANSINIGRLLPQSFYYLWAQAQIGFTADNRACWSVPCGNFGNLTAGLLASRMGMPIERFIAAVNSNRIVADYLEKGIWKERSAVATCSNAMDVARPSNWVRIEHLFDQSIDSIRRKIWACSIDDATTHESIRSAYARYRYIADPHTAVAFAALDRFRRTFPTGKFSPTIVVATAHPAKFPETVGNALDLKIELPHTLENVLLKKRQFVDLPPDFDALRQLLAQ